MRILCVGGTFSPEGGRKSGYFAKLTASLQARIQSIDPAAAIVVYNGGTYETLELTRDLAKYADVLLWFVDVSNDLPKILPGIKTQSPNLQLIQSKNNRSNKYDRPQLVERIRASRSAMLVEFGGEGKCLVGSVITENGRVLVDKSPDIDDIAQTLADELFSLSKLRFPLNKLVDITADSESFKNLDLSAKTEIPVGDHPGAFGFVRANHIHEGVDLYGNPGDLVFAMDAGEVICRKPFTGAAAGSPWWADTECVLIRGLHGVLNYGEIQPMPGVRVGMMVEAGQPIGRLATVLLKDKGRPQTMLHLERYSIETTEPILEWPLNTAKPTQLQDPTPLLMYCMKNVRGHSSLNV